MVRGGCDHMHTKTLRSRSTHAPRTSGPAPGVSCGRIVFVLLLAAASAWPSWPARAQERPLPDAAAFLAETRKHLQTDQALRSSYTYVETRRELKLDERGRTTAESVKVYESYPGLPGEERWERLIAEDGNPVPAHRLEKQDRERRKKAEEYARRLSREPKREYARQVRDYDEYRRERERAVDDVFRVYDVRMLRREPIDGHDTIVFALIPRADARPRTRDGGIMRRFSGTAWVSESDHELVRLEVEAIETVSIGFGLLARIHKGSRLAFDRRKVNGEVWLPAAFRYTGSARLGLIKTIRRGGSSEYSGYRKFTVETATEYVTPNVSR